MRKPFARLFSGLARTRRAITNGIRSALRAGPLMDEGVLEAIEDTLIAADVGVDTAAALVDTLRGAAGGREADERAVLATLAGEVGRVLASAERKARAPKPGEPLVVMVVGVNGVGKTTTIGKLARKYAEEGGKVLMAAADTFRAAAVDQLSVWARRSGSELVGGQSGGDPAAVAHDALDAALARGADVLIVDTAGRLHTRKNLMAELAKIKRVLGRRLEGAPHEVLLVLDANTGQNAVSQARLFDEALGVTGIVLAKLDGTAKGGIVAAIARELGIPVKFVGVGEGIEDLEAFDSEAFAAALVGVAGGASRLEGPGG